MKKRISPYPGLRPFTEEESIFFKGRDTHIRQIIRQLEENKIVVVTGASGDGKSSLVYAGIIPNARAGFFRAKHNNWVIADFKPERKPLTNLAESLAEKLGLEEEYVKEELSLGFSALVDLYKESTLYLDKTTVEWKNSSQEEKNVLREKAGNVLILADQFEEFFTNSENYHKGTPSDEAYTTVNVLLETAQIALDEDLPIYVVFTMRSDFISQCVAFKGLPETIGFSQFFIPRLKRHELQQVIEEPAQLAGGTVSKRLTEVLINELNEGFDRLPVLQHALNRLWLYAEEGKSELDLIHLAKLAGLPSELLPREDEVVFNDWKLQLDNEQHKHFEQAKLDNLLNTHADILYSEAFDYVQSKATWLEVKPSVEEVKLTLQIAFQSLIKNDNGRSVRNRVSVLEITQIINKSTVTPDVVCAVLNVFRLPTSTFIRPFIDLNDLSTQYLSSTTVLDITHEALIRNWEKLQEWQKLENNNQNDYRDFKTQLNRWISNDKKDSYLLSSGSMAHFERWYKRCQPNMFWIAKLDTSTAVSETKIKKAAVISNNTEEFLKRSRKQIAVIENRKKRQRLFMFGSFSIIILILAVFSFWALQEKSNAEEQKSVANAQKLVADREKNKAVAANSKAEEERLKASKSEKIAIEERELSEKARVEAEKQRQIAQEQTTIAQKQTAIAQSETEKATAEKEKASDAQLLAEKQRKRALSASDSAQQLSLLFNAQALAYKGANDYNKPQLNLLLAKQAYNFHTENNGLNNSSVITSGMLNALFFNNYKNNFTINGTNPLSFASAGDGFIVIDQFDKITRYNATLEQIQEYPVEHNNSVNRAFSLSEFSLLSLENYELLKIDAQGKQVSLGIQSSLLRVCELAPNKKVYALGFKNGELKLLNSSTNEMIAQHTVESRLTGMVFNSDNTFLFVSTVSGKVYKWNIDTNEVIEVLSKYIKITSLALIVDDSLVIGLSNGTFIVHDLNTGKESIIVNSQSAVKQISVHPRKQFFACVSDAGDIKIYDSKQLDEPPVSITDHNTKVKQIEFLKDRIWALTNKNKLYFWENDNKKYSEEIDRRLKRNFTQDEWDTYVGKHVPYQTTMK